MAMAVQTNGSATVRDEGLRLVPEARHDEDRPTRPFTVTFRAVSPAQLRLVVGKTALMHIDRSTDLPAVVLDGAAITDGHAMRDGLIPTVEELLAELAAPGEDVEVVGWGSNANVGANLGQIAWQDGVLHCLGGEPVFDRSYVCVVARRDGTVAVEEVWFAAEDGQVRVLARRGRGVADVSAEMAFATAGPPLVLGGEAVSLAHIVERFDDLRHLFSPVCVRVGGDALFFPTSQLRDGLARKALDAPVVVAAEARAGSVVLPFTLAGWARLSRHDPSGVERAARFLAERGAIGAVDASAAGLLDLAEAAEALFNQGLAASRYRRVGPGGTLRPGECRLVDDRLEIRLRPARYPHNVFVAYPEGSFGFCAFPGRSGREGVTLAEAQEALVALGARDAVLLDNGGDVRLSMRSRTLVGSSEGRERLRAILAVTAPAGWWEPGAVVAA